MAEPMEASTSGIRADGRGPEEFRTVFFKTGVLSQAKGSAYAEFGTSKVMVGVFGPRQSEVKLGFTDIGRLSCEVKFTSFAAQKLSKAELGALEASTAAALQSALEPAVQLERLPKAVLDVQCMVLEAGGSDTAVLIAAASVALAAAGVECWDLVPAVQVSKQRDGALLLDPALEESGPGCEESSMLVAVMPSEGLHAVTHLAARGPWGDAQRREALELALGAAGQLRCAMREALLAGLEERAEAG